VAGLNRASRDEFMRGRYGNVAIDSEERDICSRCLSRRDIVVA